MNKMTKEDVLAKVSWEGGLRATIEYGLKGSDIDDPILAAMWDAARDCYDVRADRWSDDAQANINALHDVLFG